MGSVVEYRGRRNLRSWVATASRPSHAACGCAVRPYPPEEGIHIASGLRVNTSITVSGRAFHPHTDRIVVREPVRPEERTGYVDTVSRTVE